MRVSRSPPPIPAQSLPVQTAMFSLPLGQVLGFDVLLDIGGHPWLMEINDHPSLRVDLELEEHKASGVGSVASAVDEAVKLPMLRDVVKVVSTLHGLGGGCKAATASVSTSASTLPSLPTPTAAAIAAAKGLRSAFGTAFHEVSPNPAEMRHLQLLARLRDIFELHSPASCVFEATWGDAQREDAQSTSSAGPRWHAPTFSRFLQSAALAGGHRASAVAAGLSRPDADLIFASVCGKGGTMDMLSFAEALACVASRLYPQAGSTHGRASPTELIERLLARHFNGGSAAPASARAATAARAAAVLKAARRQ